VGSNIGYHEKLEQITENIGFSRMGGCSEVLRRLEVKEGRRVRKRLGPGFRKSMGVCLHFTGCVGTGCKAPSSFFEIDGSSADQRTHGKNFEMFPSMVVTFFMWAREEWPARKKEKLFPQNGAAGIHGDGSSPFRDESTLVHQRWLEKYCPVSC